MLRICEKVYRMSGRFLALVAGDVSFVGRSDEFEWLRSQRAQAEAGDARVCLVSGEPGVGKSRLLREFVVECDGFGWQTLWSRCGERLPVAPFIAAIDAQAERAGVDLAGEPTAGLAPNAARLCSVLAARRPLCLVVDDLQAADDGTQALFADFVRCVADLAREARNRILILVTHHQTLAGDQLHAHLERLRREPIARSAHLTGMQEVEVHELVREAMGSDCDPQLLDALVSTTHGNPFYVLEVLNHLLGQGQLEHRGGNIATRGPVSALRLPANAPSSVAARLEGMPQEALAVLRWAALLGDPFSVEHLATVAGDAEIVEPIDEAIGRGVLIEQGDSFAFTHGIIRDALLAQMGPMRRRTSHAEIAAKLRSRFGDDPDHAEAIADHLIASGAPIATVAEGALLERAGDVALRTYRWGRGRRYFEAALNCPPYRASLQPADLGRLICKVARGAAMAGDRLVARERYFEAIDPLRESRDIEEWGRAILEWERTFTNMSEPIPDTRPYEAFREAVGERPSTARTKLLTQWAEALWLRRDNDDLAAAERAVATLGGIDDAYTRAYAFGTRGLARVRHLDCDGSLADLERSQQEALTTNHPPFIGIGATRRAMPLLLMGRVEEAIAAADSALELAQSGNDLAHSSLGLGIRQALAGLRGDWGDADRLRATATMMLTRSRYPQAAFFLHASVARERWLRGDVDAALGAADAWTNDAMRSGGRPFVLLLRVLQGERARVMQELERKPLRVPRGGADYNVLGSIGLQLELAAVIGSAPMAEAAYQALEPIARKGVIFSAGPVLLLQRLLGIGARVMGNFVVARGHLALAQEQAEEARTAIETGLVHLERARLQIDAEDSTEQVEASLSAAAAQFHRYELDWAMEQVRVVARQAGVDPARSPALTDPASLSPLDLELIAEFATGADVPTIATRLLLLEKTVELRLARLKSRPGFQSLVVAPVVAASPPPQKSMPVPKVLRDLTIREREVLRLIALGRTNQQIADALVVSIHTAQSHVKSILSKTECANRTEAARLAADAGLI